MVFSFLGLHRVQLWMR